MHNTEFFHYPNPFIRFFVNAFAGDYNKYRLALLGQITTGFLYALRMPDLLLAGLFIGLVVPSGLLYCNYKLFVFVSRIDKGIPLPKIFINSMGNNLAILFEICILTALWMLIAFGIYDKTWIRIVLTVIFPAIAIMLLRAIHVSLVFLHRKKKE